MSLRRSRRRARAFLHVPSREAIMPPPLRVETPQWVAIAVTLRASTLMSVLLVPWALAGHRPDYWTCALIAGALTAARGFYASYRRVRLN
ncbi:hypothetical protein [Streptomyces huasconensis]|uniref:hypothetical protein n=1 Tax=Streptomyces huasconensis TaxID=1854574 RepID=UPI0033D88414